LLRLLLLAGGHRRSLLGERDRSSPALTPSDPHECLVAKALEPRRGCPAVEAIVSGCGVRAIREVPRLCEIAAPPTKDRREAKLKLRLERLDRMAD
jgi:hypothetical protein